MKQQLISLMVISSYIPISLMLLVSPCWLFNISTLIILANYPTCFREWHGRVATAAPDWKPLMKHMPMPSGRAVGDFHPSQKSGIHHGFASGKSKPIAINLPFGDVLYHENGDFGLNLFLGLPQSIRVKHLINFHWFLQDVSWNSSFQASFRVFHLGKAVAIENGNL